MIDILSRIESSYENIMGTDRVNGIAGFIYDPNEINRGRFTTKISRYPDSLIKDYRRVQPYVPTPEVIKDISEHLQFISVAEFDRNLSLMDTVNDITMDDWVVHSSSSQLVMLYPSSISDLMYGDVLTPLGLLAIYLQRNYGDQAFKERVEDLYLRNYFTCIGHGIYVNKSRSNLLDVAEEVEDSLDNGITPISTDIFRWR